MKSKKIKLSYHDYRTAVNDAFSVNICNPTIFYNPEDGFYVKPSRELIPNGDTCIGLAFYNLNCGGNPSFSGSRREYAPIARAIRQYYFPGPGGGSVESIEEIIQREQQECFFAWEEKQRWG